MNVEESTKRAFVARAVDMALALPCRDALETLRGLLILGGEDSSLEEVRRAFSLLNESEQQLELIAKEASK